LRRVPIRLKLTLTFTAVMAAVLAATGLFLYLSLRAELDHAIAQGLRSRTGDISALVQQADNGLKDAAHTRGAGSDSGFAQILDRSGRVFDATPGLHRPLLSPAEIRATERGAASFERVAHMPLFGPARLLATPVRAQGRQLTVVAGASLADFDTYMGHEIALERKVAIKVMAPGLVHGPGVVHIVLEPRSWRRQE